MLEIIIDSCLVLVVGSGGLLSDYLLLQSVFFCLFVWGSEGDAQS